MKRILNAFTLLGLVLVLLSSCSNTKKLTQDSIYFQQTTDSLLKQTTVEYQSVIQKGDILYIVVNTANEVSSRLLNQPNFYGGGAAVTSGTNESTTGYLVDNLGRINFPLIGTLQVAGMQKSDLNDTLTARLRTYVQDAIVSIRLLNFKVTVLGEVQKPGSLSIPSERVTVLDALGLAGDLTAFGRRDNIKVIREVNGKREMGVLNIKKGDLFNSPYFYLRQNDVVYVEMNDRKMANVDQASFRNISIGLAVISALALVVTTLNNIN